MIIIICDSEKDFKLISGRALQVASYVFVSKTEDTFSAKKNRHDGDLDRTFTIEELNTLILEGAFNDHYLRDN